MNKLILILLIAVPIISISADLPYYAGVGMAGIRGLLDGSIFIPGDIVFQSNNNNTISITHQATKDRVIELPDQDGKILVQEPFSCGVGQAVKGIDSNGLLYCAKTASDDP